MCRYGVSSDVHLVTFCVRVRARRPCGDRILQTALFRLGDRFELVERLGDDSVEGHGAPFGPERRERFGFDLAFEPFPEPLLTFEVARHADDPAVGA